MSVYANYDDISKSYDKTRKAVGYEIILGYINAFKQKENKKIRLLDIGCGTGNYEEKLAPFVDSICCVDINKEMLNIAEKKLEKYNNKDIKFINSDILDLNLGNENFDIVICNQSLHHLENSDDTLFNGHKQVISKVSKALSKGGLFIINTISHEQLKYGVWWGDFILPAVNKMQNKFISESKLLDFFNENQMKLIDKVIPFNTIIQEDGYFDISSLLSKEFRRGDSHFSLLSNEELNILEKEIKSLLKDKEKSNIFMKEKEKLRLQTGQFSFYIAQK
jgi:ubiquinone/menaquinone biosynthesis C-methylase UbiE